MSNTLDRIWHACLPHKHSSYRISVWLSSLISLFLSVILGRIHPKNFLMLVLLKDQFLVLGLFSCFTCMNFLMMLSVTLLLPRTACAIGQNSLCWLLNLSLTFERLCIWKVTRSIQCWENLPDFIMGWVGRRLLVWFLRKFNCWWNSSISYIDASVYIFGYMRERIFHKQSLRYINLCVRNFFTFSVKFISHLENVGFACSNIALA